ncbi:MAG: DNA-3-methyladenine glycosylase [Lentisphaerae bacterium]|nr:DNA-3-methyladenine glycosylase [Lentisphaerota bacterium]
MSASKLKRDFYLRNNIILIAQELLGKRICSCQNGKLTSGIIVETEAYAGPEDRASHAYGGKRTQRTEVMYHSGGIAYVYLCYGMHSLFNVVTNRDGIPHAILVRAIEPDRGVDIMLRRRNRNSVSPSLTAGPACLTQALGITTAHNGINLAGKIIWIEDLGIKLRKKYIIAGPRVGVSYAGKDAALPWRFKIRNSNWTSKP